MLTLSMDIQRFNKNPAFIAMRDYATNAFKYIEHDSEYRYKNLESSFSLQELLIFLKTSPSHYKNFSILLILLKTSHSHNKNFSRLKSSIYSYAGLCD